VSLCRLSTLACTSAGRPSDTGLVRVVEHAYNRSFVRMYVSPSGLANISMSYSAAPQPDGSAPLQLLLETVGACPQDNCSDVAVVLTGSFAW